MTRMELVVGLCTVHTKLVNVNVVVVVECIKAKWRCSMLRKTGRKKVVTCGDCCARQTKTYKDTQPSPLGTGGGKVAMVR